MNRPMRVFLNELALAEAWTATSLVRQTLADILRARQEQSALRNALYCARGMATVQTPAGIPIFQAALDLPRDMRILLLSWINKFGPFIEDDRLAIDEDLFYFECDDVTDLGLGEAARRLQSNLNAATLSPIGNEDSRFTENKLEVVHGLCEEPIDQILVPNYTDINPLVNALGNLRPDPRNWDELLKQCRDRFDLLHIGPHCDKTITYYPYKPVAGRRIIRLLDILQQIMAEKDNSGQFSPKGLELRNKYFTGKEAWFSDESESRRNQPNKFSFPDPDGKDKLVCFWHGKISNPLMRIHFDWPIESNKKHIRICYIGPKIL